jgi:hypothetical protein
LPAFRKKGVQLTTCIVSNICAIAASKGGAARKAGTFQLSKMTGYYPAKSLFDGHWEDRVIENHMLFVAPATSQVVN